jgi:membrane-bound lytic murein transglycosylase D
MKAWSGSATILTCAAGLLMVAAARADAPAASSSAAPAASGKPPLPALPATHASAKPAAPSAAPARPTSSATPAKPALPAPPAARKSPPASAKPVKPAAKPQVPFSRASEAARHAVAGGPSADDVSFGAETPELRALYKVELELFPPAIPPLGTPWPNELASPLAASLLSPHVHATGLPPAPVPGGPPPVDGGRDLSWMTKLQVPDIPVRWDSRLVRYLEFFKDDPRGRQLFAFWVKRSGRYSEAIRRALRRKALPEDLAWLAMVESSYDPGARSAAGAVGLWQMTADTAHLYGLSTDRWADQRLSPLTETEAATEMLSDLYRRFGSWELAMAAYNMGYGATMSVVKRYNTNDYWALSRLEAALPWETTLYVPKVVATAIVARNLQVFGFQEIAADPAVDGDEIRVAPSTPLQLVATAAGCTLKEVEALNPELRGGRTPPSGPSAGADGGYPVKVPMGKGAVAQVNISRTKDASPPFDRYTVRFGETVEEIAAARRVPVSRIQEMNGIAAGEVIRGGTVLLLPHGAAAASPPSAAPSEASKPVAVVPPEAFAYAGRRRVFYRVLVGDTLPEIARSLRIDPDDLRRWNGLDPAARLQEGMTLQAFVPQETDLSHVMLLGENDVRVLTAGSDAFFAYWEGTKGRRRLVVTAKAGDTIEGIGRAYGVNAASMERINGRGRRDVLKEGQSVVVYVPAPAAARPAAAPRVTDLIDLWASPAPTPPLIAPPEAGLLPAVP